MTDEYEIVHQCEVGAIVKLVAKECLHEWQEVYYGVQCCKCGTFYAHGCEPWSPENFE